MTKSRGLRLRFKLLTGLVIVQALIIVGIAVSFYAVGWFGKEIRLQTVPIDPRDILYGDYVVLNYEINTINNSLWKGNSTLEDKPKNLYVVLKLDKASKNRTYKPIGVYDDKPSVKEDEVILRGRADYYDDSSIHLKYGLETYYISENTGKELEQKAGKGSLVSKVKVAPWGRASLVDLETE